MKGLQSAIGAWTRLLGAEHVSVDSASRSSAEQATYATHQKVTAIVRPGNVEEVQETLRIANRFKIPVYPISGGKNWGYGSRVPVKTGSVILDLKRLDKILELNEELGYITVQAGVTMAKVCHYLRKKNSKYRIDPTTSSADGSLLGNALERGHGHTLYADHVANSLNLEVVLADGRLFRTGYGRFPNSRLGPLDWWGVGPALNGLFSQSNFGVVTSMTIWLMRVPDYSMFLSIRIPDDRRFAAFVEAVRPLRHDGTIRSGLQLWNDVRGVKLGTGEFPWDRVRGRGPLPPQLLRKLAAEHGVSQWNGMIPFHGTREQVACDAKRTMQALRGITEEVVTVDAKSIKKSPSPRLVRRFACITGECECMGATRHVYWKKKGPRPKEEEGDPDRDRCGFMWCSIVTPLVGKDVVRIANLAKRTILKNRFDPDVSMMILRERVMHLHLSIGFDREDEGEDSRAVECINQTAELAAREGYFPHRLGVHAMGLLQAADPVYRELQADLKRTFDPNHVISPGRYE